MNQSEYIKLLKLVRTSIEEYKNWGEDELVLDNSMLSKKAKQESVKEENVAVKAPEQKITKQENIQMKTTELY